MATDTHIVISPSGTPTPQPFPFSGTIDATGARVMIGGSPVAVTGSTVTNTTPHMPPPGSSFQRPPSNRGEIIAGSLKVLVNGKGIARNGDKVMTCNDPTDMPVGTVIASGTVMIG